MGVGVVWVWAVGVLSAKDFNPWRFLAFNLVVKIQFLVITDQ